MSIGWPQAIYLLLVLIGLGAEIARHGELKKPARHNAVTSFITVMLIGLLLYWGGFFDGASA
ncbi:hypothetical protein ROV95_17775 [Stenotrophomonas maltophilia group sp. msm1]|uniref:hypothetical protein n=1 Tax=Stenotrophomonas maltophilia group sp. msm1 TaxID=3061099 RepID=UPI002894961B|nr:hypothetical protein [Stenotrophomonas maltophilia group sp. msm1]MDT3557947.1 hypothetical protein [Stenotrophomonas maltophilia group sp. msm1]